MEYQACFSTPFAVLGIRCNAEAIVGIDFLSAGAQATIPQDGVSKKVCDAIAQYLVNARSPFDLPLLPSGTPFQKKVWAELLRIPCGQTITYAYLARRVGSGARAVANACGANPIPIVIPCHRVVASNGLGGFMRGREMNSLNIKRWLLDHERSASDAT
jgi:methylated-DNA-[protein]-cysteine S-methyltransferase